MKTGERVADDTVYAKNHVKHSAKRYECLLNLPVVTLGACSIDSENPSRVSFDLSKGQRRYADRLYFMEVIHALLVYTSHGEKSFIHGNRIGDARIVFELYVA